MSILENLLKSYETNKSDPFLIYGIAIEYRNAENFEKALEFFKIVNSDFPDYVPNYFHLGQAYESLDLIEEAKIAYEDGIKVASKARNSHALSELRGALDLINSCV
jgi:tetratricopeptide (TPR) repeat protein